MGFDVRPNGFAGAPRHPLLLSCPQFAQPGFQVRPGGGMIMAGGMRPMVPGMINGVRPARYDGYDGKRDWSPHAGSRAIAGARREQAQAEADAAKGGTSPSGSSNGDKKS